MDPDTGRPGVAALRRLDAGAIITAGISFCAAIPLYAGVTAALGNTEAADILKRFLIKLGGKEEEKDIT